MAIAFHVCFKRVQVNQDGWKLTGTHQRLVYADAVNILGGSVHITKEKTKICSIC